MVEIKANTFFNRGHSMGEIISVIVPVYNVQKYLRRCIDSILKQTYQNLERVEQFATITLQKIIG